MPLENYYEPPMPNLNLRDDFMRMYIRMMEKRKREREEAAAAARAAVNVEVEHINFADVLGDYPKNKKK